MKGKKCLGHLSLSRAFSACLLLLLSLLFSLFAANKASAFEYVLQLSSPETLTSSRWHYYYKYGSNSLLDVVNDTGLIISRKGDDSSTYPDDPVNIMYMCSDSSFNITKDSYYVFKIYTYINDATSDVIGTINATTDSYNFSLVDIKIAYQDTLFDTQSRLISGSNAYGNYNVVYSYNNYPQQYVVFDIVLRATRSGNFPVCFNRAGVSRSIYTLPAMDYSTPGLLNYSYKFIFQGGQRIYKYELDTSSQEMNEKDEEDRQNLEDQKSESQDSSDDSQEDAENTGTTLLAAFSSFVTAITSASPSNCNLLMNMGNLNLGNVNLCQLSPPAEFQVIASIFLILFCVPLSIATARKVINLFRSFQT